MAGFAPLNSTRILALVTLLFAGLGVCLGEVHGAFVHGVASGDPTHESIIIWTRVTPTGRDQPDNVDPSWHNEFDVTWTVSTSPPWRSPLPEANGFLEETAAGGEWVVKGAKGVIGGGSYKQVPDSSFQFGWDANSVVKTGTTHTTAQRDWTVKIDVNEGLTPNVRYFFAFTVGSSTGNPAATTKSVLSPVGKFTLPPEKGRAYPSSSPPLQFAVFSCANWGFGNFHAYDAAWKGWGNGGLTAWLHLGDYYYEYGENHYPNAGEAVASRYGSLFPRNETITLTDYRERHATHRLDISLQKLHASAPMIAMWDDHEIANNPWTGGGENHQVREGDYETRVRAAIRAYHEWLPTREPVSSEWDDLANGPKAYNRTVHFGNVVSFVVLETRVVARTDPNANPYGNVFARLTKMIKEEEESGRTVGGASTAAPLNWPGSALEGKFKQMVDDLDAYRSREDKELLGVDQMMWVGETTKSSRDSGVKWQAFAQASPVMNGNSPDIEKAASALDSEGEVPAPGPYDTWLDAVRAWTEYSGDASGGSNPEGGDGDVTVGAGGRAVATASARALLALGRYAINWDFDDWRGYVAERKRFLNAVTGNANRALILGGDSHDAWAGVVGDERETWETWGADSDSNENETSDFFASAVVAEFDVPGVTPPGAYEASFPWVPSALIDKGHLIANKKTMRYAKTTQRGFLLLEVSEASAKGSFIFTPSVRDTTYVPVCDAAFEVTPSGATLKAPSGRDDSASSHSSFTGTALLNMKPSPCVSLPDSLFLGEGRDGYAGAVRVSSLRKTHDPADRSERDPEGVPPLVVIATATACALVGTLVGHYLPKKQNRKTAWRYLEVNGDNASARNSHLRRRSASRSPSQSEIEMETV